MKTTCLVLLFLVSWIPVQLGAQTQIGRTITPFKLDDVNQQEWTLEESKKFTLVAFLGVECPLVKLYAKRLQEIGSEFAESKIQIIGINSNQQDSIAEIQHFARQFEIEYPLLKDPGNKIADVFGATRTPEVFLLNQKLNIVYQGAIDDQYHYGVQKNQVSANYLRDAIKQSLAGESIDRPYTTPVGCLIGRKKTVDPNSPITYSNQISRILQKNCVNCHRSGEIAPFELTDYDEVAGWAGMIDEVVHDNRMPPWHADAPRGHFKNDIRLTQEEKDLVSQWVAAGAPEGDKSDLPKPLEFVDGWAIGKPDLELKMRKRPFRVKATGKIDYKYFEVDPGFKKDMWVKAAECRPGNRSVVHHIIVGIAGQGEFGGGRGVHGQPESEWIAATAPGSPPTIFPPGYAKRIPAGSKLIFQMHYTPNGTATTDLSRIGIVFADPSTVKHEVITQMVVYERLRIKPGDDNYFVSASTRFDRDAELLSMFPHMHYRGKAFTYYLRQPGGRYEKLLNVPNYDFNWQNSYDLATSVMIKQGARMRCTAVFDNSEKNLANPDPTKTVRWGDQTDDEMMIGYFNVAIPREADGKPNP